MNPLTWLQQRITKPTPDAYAHISPIDTQANQLLKQSIRDDSLDDALAWLQNTAKADSDNNNDDNDNDNSDVWHYSKHWQQHKAELQQRILNGTFSFQTVRDVAIKNDAGKTKHREIRCAEDRLLIRAISQTLSPIFEQSIAPECTQLSGRGGTKKPVEDSHAQLLKQPNAHVMKSDVKGYYAHIDHFILHTQFCTLLPQETELQRLLWLFLQRTVERGGNYRDVEIGIPLGASLSPQLGALYLSPLDALFSQDDKHFYRRYMDNWVIFCKNRYDLRDTVKQVHAVLHTLRVEVAPNKTYIGKVSKGFDFLGKRIQPNGILPSAAALSRMQRNTVRPLSAQKRERGASRKRIGLYWMRWLCCASISVLAGPAAAGGSFPGNFIGLEFDGQCTGSAFTVFNTVVTADGSGAANDFYLIDGSGVVLFTELDNAFVGTAPLQVATGITPVAGPSAFRITIKSAANIALGATYNTTGELASLSFDANALDADCPAQTITTTTTTTPDPEPTSNVSNPVANAINTSAITLSFAPASGAAGHVVACSTSETVAAPTDGTEITSDADCGNGAGYQFSSAASAPRGSSRAKASSTATQSSTWSNLNENTAYYFKVFPFSNSGADINYKTDSATLLKAVTDSTYVASNLGEFGGEKVTPSTYRVTVSKIEFKNSQGEYVTFAEEGSSFDIASVGANSAVGSFGKTATLPNDTYSEIRVTFASTFGLSFSGSDKNTACRTDSSGSTDSVNSALTAVATGSRDGGSAAEQQITYPSGSTADSALSSAGIRTTGGSFQVSKAASFTITDDNLPPSIGINFDATDSVEVLNSSGTCFVIPQVPSVHVTVGG